MVAKVHCFQKNEASYLILKLLLDFDLRGDLEVLLDRDSSRSVLIKYPSSSFDGLQVSIIERHPS